MAHWTERYIGEPYVETENDCAALAAKVANEVFGKQVTLPEHRADNPFGRTAQMRMGAVDLAERIEITFGEQPADGDVVLMIAAGRVSHVGVYALIDGMPWVLHAMKNAGMVVLHRMAALPYQGLEIEGYYRWK